MGSVGRVVEREIQLSTEQIIMIRQSLVLATVITLSTSQSAHSHQYQINDGGRRRFARRVITGMEPSDRNVLGRDDRSSRREFSPIFDFNSPYLMIDSEKFTVLPAVPNLINQRSQKSLSSNNNQNFLFPSTSNLKPIPAVPPRKTTTKKTQESAKPDHFFQDSCNSSSSTSSPTSISNSEILLRKKFKKCHGRCVQKFCLPVGN